VKKFVFIVHPLSPSHRKVMALRCRKIGLLMGRRDGLSPEDVSTLCRFRYGEDILGEVVCVPLLPEQLLGDQSLALERMLRAVRHSAGDGIFPSAVGLGSLCAVVARRGEELQKHLDVPVTTGNAATAYCLYKNVLGQVGQEKGPVGVVGSGSPVGLVVTELLASQGVEIRVDSRKAGRLNGAERFASPEEAASGCAVVAGCGPTGPILDPEALPPSCRLVDVALPSTLRGAPPAGCSIYSGEAMSMPSRWHRGFWGPLYHMVSGYGYSTVLACLVEPLAVVSAGLDRPLAQGRSVAPEDALLFGTIAEGLGFLPRRRIHSSIGKPSLSMG
jgi:predicted amino acid dehydrogenase